MEPPDYPRDDPGPHTLLTSLSGEDNLQRLQWVLGRTAGYVGAVSTTAGRLAAETGSLRPIFEDLKSRGLMFLDGRTENRGPAGSLAAEVGLPYAGGDSQIDREASARVIDGSLEALERRAQQTGFALGLARPYPVTLERLARWISTLERKQIALAPVSALANRQPLP